MKIFVDLEFTGLVKGAEVISVSFIPEDDNIRSLHLEITDYPKDISKWIRENVITKLYCNNSTYVLPDWCDYMNDTADNCAERAREYLLQFDTVEWIMDVGHYDMVLLIDFLYGCALDIPENIAACYTELNDIIAEYFDISPKAAFDLNREEISNFSIDGSEPKHNSLFDTFIAKLIYDKMK